MAYSSPVEERRLQYLARAGEAREKAEQTAHPEIRGWWTNAAEAWEYLAAHPETRLARFVPGAAYVGRRPCQ